MNAVALTRESLAFVHTMIELRVDAADPRTFFVARPGSGVQSAAAIYAHTVIGEDHFVSERLGQPLLYESNGWRGRLGFEPSAELRPEWATMLTGGLEHLRAYAEGVYARSDAWLAALSKEDSERLVQNWQVIREVGGKVRYNERQVGTLVGLLENVTLHTIGHAGEIAVVMNLGR